MSENTNETETGAGVNVSPEIMLILDGIVSILGSLQPLLASWLMERGLADRADRIMASDEHLQRVMAMNVSAIAKILSRVAPDEWMRAEERPASEGADRVDENLEQALVGLPDDLAEALRAIFRSGEQVVETPNSTFEIRMRSGHLGPQGIVWDDETSDPDNGDPGTFLH